MPVRVNDDGVLGGNIEVCLGDGDEIHGTSPAGTQAECSARCTADKQCAAFTYVQGQCILQNRQVVAQHPGYVLGQATGGVDTHVRNCAGWNEKGECVDAPSAPGKTCYAFGSAKDRHDVRECAETEEQALKYLAARHGDGRHFPS